MPNLSTILVGLVVFGVFGAIVVREFHRHKQGKGSCSCGCGSCPGHGLCHPEK
ncbi:MAG: FeoB-associated Cys-rich membrane protein [Oscillospiraceae bacterium]|nr:FeoB-associated Cys-rich membrane protein [Oscillospiraceae bacterium]